MTEKQVIELQRWWLDKLRVITREVISQEEKRQARAKARNANMLAGYTGKDDINDAYGYGMITEKKRDRLLDLWDQAESADRHDDLYRMKIDLLQELFEQGRQIMRDLGQEV